MKPITLLVLASSLLMTSPAAFAQQDPCQNRYGACMDRCITRPASAQQSCSSSCEAQSNQCYAGLYGPAPSAMGQTTAAPSNAKDAGVDARGAGARTTRDKAKPAHGKPAKTSK